MAPRSVAAGLGLLFSFLTLVQPRGHAPAEPKEIHNHEYIFVIGQHHSGTTILDLILCQHNNISCIQRLSPRLDPDPEMHRSLPYCSSRMLSTPVLESNAPQNEGQHLQHVYPSARKLGGMQAYALHSEGHLLHNSSFMTSHSGQDLFRSWSRYWNTSNYYLLEKSPRHVIMTRFLQEAFAPHPTYFLFIMRHPLGCSHYNWRRRWRALRTTCGREILLHWLQVHEYFAADHLHLHNIMGIQFELYLNRSKSMAQAYTNIFFDFLHIPDPVQLEFSEDHSTHFDDEGHSLELHDIDHNVIRPHPIHDNGDSGTDDDDAVVRDLGAKADGAGNDDGGRSDDDDDDDEGDDFDEDDDKGPDHGLQRSPKRLRRRRLLEFHGDIHHVKVRYGGVYSWINDWNRIVDMDSPICQAVVADLEPRLNRFGYSLKDLTWIGEPEPLADLMLKDPYKVGVRP